MSTFTFQPANKQKCKLRIALYGVSGSGKTYSALRIATGIGGRIALIDTEGGSASKYARKFKFDTISLESPDIPTMIGCMIAAAGAGYDILVIDSLSHSWQELLDEVSQLTATSRTGNSFQTWAKATPKQHRLIRAILHSPMHVIATMRAKTEWSLDRNEKGKAEPRRVGLAPRQGKDIEFEFDVLGSIDSDHSMLVQKDRSSLFQDKLVERPDEAFGRALAEWADDGSPNESLSVDAMRSEDEEPGSHEHGLDDLKRSLSADDEPTDDINSFLRYLVEANREVGIETTEERLLTKINADACSQRRDPIEIAKERAERAREAIATRKETT